MRILLVLLIVTMVGCSSQVAQYSFKNQVDCERNDVPGYDCTKGHYYKKGLYKLSECSYEFICSDGTILKERY